MTFFFPRRLLFLNKDCLDIKTYLVKVDGSAKKPRLASKFAIFFLSNIVPFDGKINFPILHTFLTKLTLLLSNIAPFFTKCFLSKLAFFSLANEKGCEDTVEHSQPDIKIILTTSC